MVRLTRTCRERTDARLLVLTVKPRAWVEATLYLVLAFLWCCRQQLALLDVGRSVLLIKLGSVLLIKLGRQIATATGTDDLSSS